MSVFYEDAARLLREAPLKEGLDKGFAAAVTLKGALYAAEACRLVAGDLGKDKDVGPQIARLKQGLLPLSRELRAAKGSVPEKLWAAASAHEAELKRLLAAAERDNECVYMMRVPASDALPPLAGAALVKPTPMAPVLDAGGERLLRAIVPDDSAKALSKYSEMVDELIRNEAASLAAASDAARVRLREMELPGAFLFSHLQSVSSHLYRCRPYRITPSPSAAALAALGRVSRDRVPPHAWANLPSSFLPQRRSRRRLRRRRRSRRFQRRSQPTSPSTTALGASAASSRLQRSSRGSPPPAPPPWRRWMGCSNTRLRRTTQRERSSATRGRERRRRRSRWPWRSAWRGTGRTSSRRRRATPTARSA